jgi:hypothetical protein
LFNGNLSKEQVQAFSGHSDNSNTALKHYHDHTNNWLGHVLVAGASQESGVEEVEDRDESEEEDQQDVGEERVE